MVPVSIEYLLFVIGWRGVFEAWCVGSRRRVLRQSPLRRQGHRSAFSPPTAAPGGTLRIDSPRHAADRIARLWKKFDGLCSPSPTKPT